LLYEPRRLGRRYLVEPWFIMGIMLNDVLSRRFKSKGAGPRP
jgi:UDP-N-acetyl-D-mannosaminuronic acid transferase (WecB/TagA/CpsF family)